MSGWPLARTVFFSLTDASLGNTDSIAWVGIDNYTRLMRDPDWWIAVKNTAFFTLASVSLEVVFGLAIALIMNAPLRGRGLLRAAVLVPWAIPTVVSAKMWAWMFNDLYGVVNDVLLRTNLIQERISWLAEDTLSLMVVVAVDVWKTTPFIALLLLAGLQTIPKSLYEAASLDGANYFQKMSKITVPLLLPTLVIAVIFRSLDAIRVFDLVYVLTSNSRSSATVSIYTRQQLVDFQDFGYGSAASCTIFLLLSLLTLCYFQMIKKRSEAVI